MHARVLPCPHTMHIASVIVTVALLLAATGAAKVSCRSLTPDESLCKAELSCEWMPRRRGYCKKRQLPVATTNIPACHTLKRQACKGDPRCQWKLYTRDARFIRRKDIVFPPVPPKSCAQQCKELCLALIIMRPTM